MAAARMGDKNTLYLQVRRCGYDSSQELSLSTYWFMGLLNQNSMHPHSILQKKMAISLFQAFRVPVSISASVVLKYDCISCLQCVEK